MTITTVKDTREEWTETTSLILGSMDGQYEARIDDAIIGKFPAARDDLAPAKKDWSKFDYMDEIEFEDIEAKVEALICIAHEETWVGWEVKRGKKGEPTVMKTAFGWTVAGVSGRRTDNSAAISLLSSDDRCLREDMKKIFLNDFPIAEEGRLSLSREAQSANEQLEKSVRWNVEKGK